MQLGCNDLDKNPSFVIVYAYIIKEDDNEGNIFYKYVDTWTQTVHSESVGMARPLLLFLLQTEDNCFGDQKISISISHFFPLNEVNNLDQVF